MFKLRSKVIDICSEYLNVHFGNFEEIPNNIANRIANIYYRHFDCKAGSSSNELVPWDNPDPRKFLEISEKFENDYLEIRNFMVNNQLSQKSYIYYINDLSKLVTAITTTRNYDQSYEYPELYLILK